MSSTESNSDNSPEPGWDALKEHMKTHKQNMAMWVSRLLTMLFTLLYLTRFFENRILTYNRALLANAGTSILRLHQRHPRVDFTLEYLAKIIFEDSCHYFLYSCVFLYVTPFLLGLVPVFLFSLIHFASYSLTLLDTLGQNSWWGARLLISLVEFQSRNILNLIACTEIVLMPFTVMLCFMGRASILTPLLYYQFLTMRYRSQRNPYTKNKVNELRSSLEALACHPQTPRFIKKLILSTISIVGKFSTCGFLNELTPPGSNTHQSAQ